MARWKLTEAHYLKVPGTNWEYNSIDRRTGRPKREIFNVPLQLDPKSIDDLTKYGQPDPGFPSRDVEDYIIVVSDIAGVNQRDVVFEGNPTPGMLPLDDEAKELSAACAKGLWKPTPGVDDDSQRQSYANGVIDDLMGQMNNLKDEVHKAPQIEGLSELMSTMAAMMKQNQEILGALVKSQSKGAHGRVG
jgi:hypothetical protein